MTALALKILLASSAWQKIGRGSFKTVFKGIDMDTGAALAWCQLPDPGKKFSQGGAQQVRGGPQGAEGAPASQHCPLLRLLGRGGVA